MNRGRSDSLFIAAVAAAVALGVWIVGNRLSVRPAAEPIVVDGSALGAIASPEQSAGGSGALSEEQTLGAEETADEDLAPAVDPALAAARGLKRERRHFEAIEVLRGALARAPDDPAILAELGTTLITAGKPDDAAALLARAVAADGSDARTHFNLGVARSASGDKVAAIAAYQRAIELKPFYSKAHYNLGVVQFQLGNLDAAETCFRRLVETDRSANGARAWFQIGFIMARRNRTEDAAAAYRQALVLRPDYIEARNNLALMLERGDAESAITEFEKAVRLDPTAASAQFNLGRLYSAAGRLEEAVASYERAAAADASMAKASYNQGVLLERLGRPEAAAAAYEKAVAADPENAGVLARLGSVYRDLGRLDEAGAALTRAVRVDPKLAGAWNSLGIFYARQGREEDAIRAYTEATRLDPEEVPARFNMALALARLGRQSEAAAALRAVIDLDPSHLAARAQLVRLYVRAGDEPNARDHAAKLERLAPGDPVTRDAMAGIESAFGCAGERTTEHAPSVEP